MKKYKVLHPYLSYSARPPILIPAGTVGEWAEEENAYLFQVGNVVVPVGKWAVEVWKEYFQEVTE